MIGFTLRRAGFPARLFIFAGVTMTEIEALTYILQCCFYSGLGGLVAWAVIKGFHIMGG